MYGLCDITINLYPYEVNNLSTSSTEVLGFMQKNPFKEREYSVFYCDENIDFKELLLHECAHIRQYEDGDLTLINGEEFWKGKSVDGWSNYWSRPHERNARKKVRKIKRLWRKELRSL